MYEVYDYAMEILESKMNRLIEANNKLNKNETFAFVFDNKTYYHTQKMNQSPQPADILNGSLRNEFRQLVKATDLFQVERSQTERDLRHVLINVQSEKEMLDALPDTLHPRVKTLNVQFSTSYKEKRHGLSQIRAERVYKTMQKRLAYNLLQTAA